MTLAPRDVADLRDEVAAFVTTAGFEAQDVVLIVSELATNVIQHACGKCVLTLSQQGEDLLIVMGDKSAAGPRLVDADWESGSGRGIALIDAMAAKWGWDPAKSGKRVWLLLPLEATSSQCHKCEVSVPRREPGTIYGQFLRDGAVCDYVYCRSCSAHLVRQRSGVGEDDDSGWGVAPICLSAAA